MTSSPNINHKMVFLTPLIVVLSNSTAVVPRLSLYEFCGTVESFSLCIAVKPVTKLNLEHSERFDIEI